MKIQTLTVRTQGILPFQFKDNKPQRNDNEQDPDWGNNPNPDGYEPNWKLMANTAAAGVFGGVSLGILGSNYLGIHPFPLVAVGSIAGAYLGGAIGLAFPIRKPE